MSLSLRNIMRLSGQVNTRGITRANMNRAPLLLINSYSNKANMNRPIVYKPQFNNNPSILTNNWYLQASRQLSTKPELKEKEKVVEVEVKDKEKDKAVVVKKKPIMARIKEEIMHYYHGFKLLGLETRISSKLLFRMMLGHDLSRREQRQLKRSTTDLLRLVPFLVFIIVPFMEFLLPVALKLFPNMLPSTFESKDQAELKRQKLFKARLEVSNFLQDTVAEHAKSGKALNPDASTEFRELFRKVRNTGDLVPTDALIKLAKELKDELTLDNLSRPQLVSLCRYLNVPAFGTDAMLTYQIRNRMRYLRADDRMINAEGVEELTDVELQQACQSRGIRTFNTSPQAMRDNLQQWLELNLRHKVPVTILIMSQAFSIPTSQDRFSPEVLQATLSSLPDELVKEAELTYSETLGAATNKQRLEVIAEQEERIQEEKEQQAAEEEARLREEQEEKEEKERKELERAQQTEKAKPSADSNTPTPPREI